MKGLWVLAALCLLGPTAYCSAAESGKFTQNLLKIRENYWRHSDRKGQSSSDENSAEVKQVFSNNSRNVTLAEYNANPEAYANDLRTNGLWMSWSAEADTNIPLKAVYGGFKGKYTFFLMRADHQEKNGHYVGKILGKFSPYMKKATITFDGVEYEKPVFELFLHDEYGWASIYEDREMIEAGNGQFFCRFEYDYLQYSIPGQLTEGTSLCTISYDGIEYMSGGYEVLVHACSGKSANSSVSDAPPVHLTYKQFLVNPELFRSYLNGNGLWIYWNVKKAGVPPYSVFAGFGQGPNFPIIADHMDENGVYMGKIPGIYYPRWRLAYIEHDGKEYEKTIFDILLHSSYKWTEPDDETNKLIQVDANYGFCMRPQAQGSLWLGGRYNIRNGLCETTYYGQTRYYTAGFRVLRRACE